MAYSAILEARQAVEAKQDNVREAVRLGLQMKREEEARKAALRQQIPLPHASQE
ncbi:Arc/MetJ-type ribon-helix-helix transcriptional regulator [Sagittula marina]|uniref:Arc/MetJ-type ribon-helix-helix transcriptional regulator n=1 Tax=Sagittula marina TaxID=943940 RepID=A0A7W6GT23_9RHOB|nr:hypothetical protein [Sagittula marina]MBB3986402.1 Arc/MetJ-type ribon-helix-helix transcriptional regulator [Sagittula marina]